MVQAIKGTITPKQRERVELVNESGEGFEVDLIVADIRAGSHLKLEEGAWMHGKREGRHLWWGVNGQLEFDAGYRDGEEQKEDTGP